MSVYKYIICIICDDCVYTCVSLYRYEKQYNNDITTWGGKICFGRQEINGEKILYVSFNGTFAAARGIKYTMRTCTHNATYNTTRWHVRREWERRRKKANRKTREIGFRRTRTGYSCSGRECTQNVILYYVDYVYVLYVFRYIYIL